MAALRLERRLSQEDLAERAGLAVSYVSRIERGVRTPSVQVLAGLAQALEAPLWRLVADQRVTAEEAGWRERLQRLGRAAQGLREGDLELLTAFAYRLHEGGGTPKGAGRARPRRRRRSPAR